MAPHARTLCVPHWLGGPNLFDTWEITGCHYLHEGEHLITVGHSSASMDVTIALGVPAGNGATGLPAAVTGLVLVCTFGIWCKARKYLQLLKQKSAGHSPGWVCSQLWTRWARCCSSSGSQAGIGGISAGSMWAGATFAVPLITRACRTYAGRMGLILMQGKDKQLLVWAREPHLVGTAHCALV